jgi:hypothetical protein
VDQRLRALDRKIACVASRPSYAIERACGAAMACGRTDYHSFESLGHVATAHSPGSLRLGRSATPLKVPAIKMKNPRRQRASIRSGRAILLDHPHPVDMRPYPLE